MILTKKIPFYGKYNSISNIVLSEDELTFLVTRYDSIGNENKDVFEIAKKKKNIDLLTKDYYGNVEEYLKKNKDKYQDYKSKKITLKKNLNIKTIAKLKNIALASFTLATLLLLTSLLTTSSIVLYYIGFLIIVPSTTGLLLLSDIKKETNIKDFINDYEEFSKNLDEYKTKLENKNKKTLTEYNGLNKDKNKGNDLKLTKIRAKENIAA